MHIMLWCVLAYVSNFFVPPRIIYENDFLFKLIETGNIKLLQN